MKNRFSHITSGFGFKAALVFFAIMAIIPLATNESYILHIGILCMMYSCYSLSWNLVSGFAGIFGLGFQALAGVGGYTSALLAIKAGISPWIGIFVGGLFALVVGSVFCIPCLKLKEMPYIAISSTCLGECVRLVVANLVDLTRGEMGLWGMGDFPNVGAIKFEGGNRISYWYLVMIFLAIYLLVVNRIVKAPLGSALSAIRDSQPAASSLGINVPATKMRIYMISSFMVGVIGGFYAHYMGILTPSSVLGAQMMTQIVAMTLLGGLGTIAGPVVGSFTITILTETLRILGDYRMVIYGLIIVLAIIFLPKGIWGTLKPSVYKKLDEMKAKKTS